MKSHRYSRHIKQLLELEKEDKPISVIKHIPVNTKLKNYHFIK